MRLAELTKDAEGLNDRLSAFVERVLGPRPAEAMQGGISSPPAAGAMDHVMQQVREIGFALTAANALLTEIDRIG